MLKQLALGLSLVAGLTVGIGSTATAQTIRPPEENFVLLGLVVVDGENGLAWLTEPRLTQNRPMTVRQGEMVGPYRVARILDDRVVLEGPSGAISVPMLTSGGGSAVAAVPGGPAMAVPSPAARGVGAGHQNPAVSAAPGALPRNPLTLPADVLQERARASDSARAMLRAAQRAGTDPAARTAQTGQAPAAQPSVAQPSAPPQGTTTQPGAAPGQGGELTDAQILAGGTPTFQNPNVRYFPIGDPRRNQFLAPR